MQKFVFVISIFKAIALILHADGSVLKLAQSSEVPELTLLAVQCLESCTYVTENEDKTNEKYCASLGLCADIFVKYLTSERTSNFDCLLHCKVSQHQADVFIFIHSMCFVSKFKIFLLLALDVMPQRFTKHNPPRRKLPTNPSPVIIRDNKIVYGLRIKRCEFQLAYSSAAIFIEHSRAYDKYEQRKEGRKGEFKVKFFTLVYRLKICIVKVTKQRKHRTSSTSKKDVKKNTDWVDYPRGYVPANGGYESTSDISAARLVTAFFHGNFSSSVNLSQLHFCK